VEKEERRRGGLVWEKEKENEPAGFGPGRDELFFSSLFFFLFKFKPEFKFKQKLFKNI